MSSKSRISALFVLATAFAAAINVPASARQLVTPLVLVSSTGQSSKQVKQIESFASLNEDLVDYILTNDRVRTRNSGKAIAQAAPQLKTALNRAMFTEVASHVAAQQKALAHNDTTAAALASVEIYRLLQNAIDPELRTAPLQIAMLDYSGFKLSVLAKSTARDWRAIDATAEEMNGFWTALSPQIKDPALRDLVDSIGDGVRKASAIKDAAYLAFAGQMLLNVVDILEGQFS